MTALIGAFGWGLVTVAALTHLWHRDRLHELLAMHFERPAPVANLLIAAEVAIAVLGAAAIALGAAWLPAVALAGGLLGIAFCTWIARLLLRGSPLPCACSFSEAPTNGWSLVRAAAVMSIGVLAFGDVGTDLTAGERISALTIGLAAATALYVLPEARSWPDASRAQLARLDSHTPAIGERMAQP